MYPHNINHSNDHTTQMNKEAPSTEKEIQPDDVELTQDEFEKLVLIELLMKQQELSGLPSK